MALVEHPVVVAPAHPAPAMTGRPPNQRSGGLRGDFISTGAEVHALGQGEGEIAVSPVRQSCKLREVSLHDQQDHGDGECITGQTAETDCPVAEMDFHT